MTFLGRAVVVGSGEGEAVSALGSRYRYKVVGGDTGGAYSLVEETLLEGGPPLHVHDGEEEAFYVLEGRGRFLVDGEERELAAGDFVLVPRGVPHTLARSGGEPLRMLVIVSPAGFEQFFVAVERRQREEGPLDEDQVVELADEHRCRIIGPPLDQP
jgi:mannose-6-phosphate isomerase-like protein (cupin superfamily)